MPDILHDHDSRLDPEEETVDEFYHAIARNIRNRRMNLNPPVSMDKIARYMGVSSKTISRWENGKDRRIPGPRQLLGLSKIFGCNPADLFDGVPGM
ncbi:MAG: helix-turn-helix domain-containing protein [Actinomycetia bacterium]|nr:helix-turn-helix domain-containing protein [Actinomycetes bacterium]MCG2817754.1 helix-turn-helix domain-containing protein [Actinomycetes bacterium]